MTLKVKNAGNWKNVKNTIIKSSGQFYDPKKIYAKKDGVWSIVYDNTTKNDTGILRHFFNAIVYASCIHIDGSILIAGRFTSYNDDTSKNCLIKLNGIDGNVNNTFSNNIGSIVSSFVYSVTSSPNGNIFVGGNFTSFAGISINRIIALNSDGTKNVSFNTNIGSGANNAVQCIKSQSDNKLIAVGDFTSFNGASYNRIIRLNSDGTIDSTFQTNINTGFNAFVYKIAIQPDGKILVAGSFTQFKGNTRNRLVRLNPDGTEDTSFYTNLGTGFDNTIYDIVVQSDNKILVGGAFSSFNSTSRSMFMRLNADGTQDTTYNNVVSIGYPDKFWSGAIQSIGYMSNGKVFVGGTMYHNLNSRYYVCLNADGTEDLTFMGNCGRGTTGQMQEITSVTVTTNNELIISGFFESFGSYNKKHLCILKSTGIPYDANINNVLYGLNFYVNSLSTQSDNKILIGGEFNGYDKNTRNRLIRINSDFTDDTTFNVNLGTGFNDIVYAVKAQADGKVLVGGIFSTFNSVSNGCMVRLNSDGTQDTTFNTNLGTGFNSIVSSIFEQSDNKILVGGNFSSLNGVSPRNSIVRLNSDGTLDVAFTTNLGNGLTGGGVQCILTQSDNKILIGGNFTTAYGGTKNGFIRINADGTQDTAFNGNLIGASIAFNTGVYCVATQSDNKILIGG